MERLMPTILLAVSLAMGGLPTEAQAQAVETRPTAAELMQRLRIEDKRVHVVQILNQRYTTYPEAYLDEIADSLAALAVTMGARGDLEGLTAAREAVSILFDAGGRDAGILVSGKLVRDETPYRGAAERLMRIVEHPDTDAGIRAGALTALCGMPDRERTIEYLRSVAVSENPVADLAVRILGGWLGPRFELERLDLLRELYREGLVTEPRALMQLEAYADHYGWE